MTGGTLPAILDPRAGSLATEVAATWADIALQCVNTEPAERPGVAADLVPVLRGILVTLQGVEQTRNQGSESQDEAIGSQQIAQPVAAPSPSPSAAQRKRRSLESALSLGSRGSWGLGGR